MKDVSAYIRELLFVHDCVILPDFGGLIGNYTPAKINKSTNTFSPPLKAISFNRSLIHNDGLLIGRISERLNIGYADSKRLVEDYITDLKKKIKGGERVHLDMIGYFQNNKEGSIQFEPDRDSNYLPGSYGLSSFVRMPVENYEVSETVFRKSDKDPLVLANRRKMVWRAAIAVPFIAAMIIIPLKTDLFRSNASLNPMAKAQFEEAGAAVQPETAAIIITEAKTEDAVIEEEVLSEAAEGEGAEPEAVNIDIPDNEPLVTSTKGDGLFYLIIGSFKSQNNASEFFNDISKSETDAELFKGDNGFIRVSLESYGTKKEAESRRDIRRNDYPDIWIWKK